MQADARDAAASRAAQLSEHADAAPFIGLWTYARMEDEQYHAALAKQGLPWAVRKLLQAFTAQREFVVEADGRFLFRSKMLTGSGNELHIDEPTVFSVLGYTVDTLVTLEAGPLLVSTCTTTAADGFVTSGWTETTRITHAIDENGELVITTIASAGEYRMWMTRDGTS